MALILADAESNSPICIKQEDKIVFLQCTKLYQSLVYAHLLVSPFLERTQTTTFQYQKTQLRDSEMTE